MEEVRNIRREVRFSEEEWNAIEECMRKSGYKKFSSWLRSVADLDEGSVGNDTKSGLCKDVVPNKHTFKLSDKQNDIFLEAMRISGIYSKSIFFRRVVIPYLESIVEGNEIRNLIYGEKTLYERLLMMEKKISMRDEVIKKVEILFNLLSTQDNEMLAKELENFEFWMKEMMDSNNNLKKDFNAALEIIAKKIAN